MSDPQQVVVVGGGISGLACAFRLMQIGVQVTLLEAADRVGGKRCGVMVNADAHPSSVVGDIIDPVRHGTAEFLDDEVMHPHVFGGRPWGATRAQRS